MAKRKRATRRSGIVGRAVSAGRAALREAEKRVPPELRRQLERRIKDADKAARAAIKQLQAQARKASTRADVNSVLKRIDGLTKQARQAAGGTGSRASSTRRRAASTTKRATTRARRAATNVKKAVGSARRKAPSATTTRRGAARTTATARRAAAPRRRATSRRSSGAAAAPEMPEMIAPEAGGAVEMGEITES